MPPLKNKTSLRHAALSFAGFGLLTFAFLLIAKLVGADYQAVVDFDHKWISRIQAYESPGWTKLADTLSWIGSTKVVIVFVLILILLMLFVRHLRWEPLLLLCATAGSGLLNLLLKNLFRRDRPDINRLAEEFTFSFPSGHSMGAFALYGILAYLLWRMIPSFSVRIAALVLCTLLTLSIGLSRIYLGVHYPSDVIGGYIASAAWLALTIGIFEYWRHTKQRRLGGQSEAERQEKMSGDGLGI
ncbi:phosphatase PAP2 family protein [Saccharibacillus kuerlensis]|uniref:Phosphatase PAP2 family protein n=1 Tax=Saccharibacillus kuerlensis TaxID=459527 RepID=A0ABQ2L1D7_9BACL|nr:phosphatase PAP2 family protein [Saccharibacillus kuerlensis]GGN99509.1 phosphatase PAP2 family protein [Saccharibacillus kuerlensis]